MKIKKIELQNHSFFGNQEFVFTNSSGDVLDTMAHLIALEECMIYGHLGNIEKAKQLFEEYYQSAVDEYNDLMKNGHKQYLKKGERVVFMGQDITAEKDGYVTLYGANHGHIEYLDELAVRLDLR